MQSGKIASLQEGASPEAGDERVAILVPALGNLHSHAFQRAMAGFAEVSGDSADNFWSWREAMYRLAHRMNPEQLEAIAAQAYVEMLESGFARVGEFHYLHHDPNGAPYSDAGEMSGEDLRRRRGQRYRAHAVTGFLCALDVRWRGSETCTAPLPEFAGEL